MKKKGVFDYQIDGMREEVRAFTEWSKDRRENPVSRAHAKDMADSYRAAIKVLLSLNDGTIRIDKLQRAILSARRIAARKMA